MCILNKKRIQEIFLITLCFKQFNEKSIYLENRSFYRNKRRVRFFYKNVEKSLDGVKLCVWWEINGVCRW